MTVDFPVGEYVIAVSGGVDSMSLLDILASRPQIGLIVAHFNHGIREDSDKDEELVRRRADELNLPFEVGYGSLGPKASEAAARKARYDFLHSVKDKYQADSIITAHHLDDALETAIINLIRGTGRKGLSAISANKQVRRPLLSYSKSEILTYAKTKGIIWREDETNESDDYLRNYLRKGVLKRLSGIDKRRIQENIDKVAEMDIIIDSQIAKISQYTLINEYIDRSKFSQLPSRVGEELVFYWLRQKGVRDFDRKTIHRASNAIKTNRAYTVCYLKSNLSLTFTANTAKFVPAE
jgi:tRNA(Ile)-lysidine synthetase-like protein